MHFCSLLSTCLYFQDPHAPNNGVSKGKLAKDKPNLKGATPISRIQRAILSQSLSFPARGARVDAMKKSIDVYPVKSEVKHTRSNATKAEAPFPSSRLSHQNRRASTGIHSNDENKAGGTSVRRTTLASIPSIRSSAVRLFRFIRSTYILFVLLCLHVANIRLLFVSVWEVWFCE